MDFLSPAARDFASAAKVNLNLSHARARLAARSIDHLRPLRAQQEVGKRLAYGDDDDDGSDLPTGASVMQPMLDADLAPLLELPDPDDVSSAAVVSADSAVTQTQVMIPRSIPICSAPRVPFRWCLNVHARRVWISIATIFCLNPSAPWGY
jgi:hypothetical protein